MSVSHRYKNLGGRPKQSANETTSSEDPSVEDEKLASFEAGYQAGWDDATKAQADDRTKISAEFGQNLQDIAFTYHEAITKLSASFEPILQEIIEKVLPELAKETLGVHVIEQVKALVREGLQSPVEIVVAPSNENRIKSLVANKISEPFSILVDESLNEEQVFVRVGSSEKQIDLQAIIEGVAEATTAFFHEVKEPDSDG